MAAQKSRSLLGNNSIMYLRRVLILLLLLVLSACSSFLTNIPFVAFSSDDRRSASPTLADLSQAAMPNVLKPLPTIDLEQLIASYRQVLDVTEDKEIRLQVMRRLAGLEMKRGENKLYEQEALAGQFDLAIRAYLKLLQDSPNYTENDLLLYQLSKAYDLGGQLEKSMVVLDQLVEDYPHSKHYGEAQFRRAELLFSRQQYQRAELAYAEVIGRGELDPYYQNSLYMHGWSQFKQQRFRAALKSFSKVLDLNIAADGDLDSLSRGNREITEDTLKVMSIVFSYIDGPATITQVFKAFGDRPYMPLLYENLGKLYLKQQRFRDSAEAYRAYITQNPTAVRTPEFYTKVIEAFTSGGFTKEVLEEKRNFITFYDFSGKNFRTAKNEQRERIQSHLKTYIPELGKHYHAIAQAAGAAGKVIKTNKLEANDGENLKKIAREDYVIAGDYYQKFFKHFPNNSQTPEMRYLFAESRFSAGIFSESIDAYESVAYQSASNPRSAEAGYAAIVAYGRLLKEIPSDLTEDATRSSQYSHWLRRKITSQLQFTNSFPKEDRAAAVLAKSTEELLEIKEYTEAVEAGMQLVTKYPDAAEKLIKTGWLVIGHSEFELQHFKKSEHAYQQTLLLSDKADPEIIERMAASVYKQAELDLKADRYDQAAEQYLRVHIVAPSSAIGIIAQYDAANALLSAKNYSKAIVVLNDFRSKYPQHVLSEDIPAKLIIAYQQDEQWTRAADELTLFYANSSDDATKKESLYQAAELYLKANNKTLAIERFRSYAHAYPDPLGAAMEARYHLSELYRETQQAAKRRFWLKKMMLENKKAKSERTGRSDYLAAFSASVLANDDYLEFRKIPLNLPLKLSLMKKRVALTRVLESYRLVNNYEVEEFSTMATYRIGTIYWQLSSDLMASDRPVNLDELAMEQYELLLEEQAFPFEEKAIEIHEANAQRSWHGIYDEWVKNSFSELKELIPARYNKQEKRWEDNNEIH